MTQATTATREWIDTFAPRRELGRTGFIASVLGIGDLADRQVPIERCVATVQRAIAAGCNVIDTAPGYEDGYSERIVGQAVRTCGKPRDQLFVITKIDHHDQPVGLQVDESLARMQLDHADLFVFHGLSTLDGWRRIAADGGPMQELAACQKQGRLRFRGISSHDPAVLLEAIPTGLCDVVMFPIGPFVDERYVTQVLPLARRHRVGTVCFKTFGAGKLLGDTPGYNQPLQQRPRGKFSSGGGEAAEGEPVLPRLTVRECVHYTLTCDPDVALLGLSFPNEQDAAFAAATDFSPLHETAMADVRRRAAEAVRDKGRIWWNPA